MTGYQLLDNINQYIINPIILLMMAVAFVVFVWGVVVFIAKQDDTEAVEKGKKHMLWGILGLAIMVSVFGIIKVIVNFVADFG